MRAGEKMSRSTRSGKILSFYVGAVMVFLAVPILVIIPSAFSAGSSLSFPPQGFSLRWFVNIFTWKQFLPAFMLSGAVAITATAISLVIGTLAAFAIVRRRFVGQKFLLDLFLMPLIFPAIVLAVGIAMVLSPLGLLRTFPGLVIAHVLITLPYVVRTVVATLSEIDKSYEEAAAILGANGWNSFRRVLLPLLRPALIAGATFSLIISFDEFTISMFLVGPGMMTLPLEIYNYTEFSMDPTVAAISTILIALSALCIFVIDRTVGFGKQFGG